MKSRIRKINSGASHVNIKNESLNVDILISTNNKGIREVEIFDTTSKHQLCFERNTYRKVSIDTMDYTLSEKIKDLKSENFCNTDLIVEKEYISENTLFIRVPDYKNVIGISVKNKESYFQIQISGECDVINNNESCKYECLLSAIYEGYSKEIFQYIREYEDYINIENDVYEIDLRLDNSHVVTAYIDKSSSDVHLRYDSIKEVYALNDSGYRLSESFPNISDSIEKKIKQSYLTAIDDIRKLGFKTAYSHDQSTYDAWGWTDVIIKITDFNKKNLTTISKIMFNHEDVVKKYV